MERIERSIEVNVPLHTAYNQLTQFEQYPRFMQDVEKVQQLDDTHLRWHARRGGRELEWDAEITEQVPDRRIAWRSTSGPAYAGAVELLPMEQAKTRVTLRLECELDQQQIAAASVDPAQMFGARAEQDLARFKKLIENLGQETGEWRGTVKNAQVIDAGRSQDTQMAGADAGKAVGRTMEEQQSAGADMEHPAQEEPHVSAHADTARRQARFPGLLQRWEEPLAVMRKMSEEMDQFFEKTVGRPMVASRWRQAATSSSWAPAVEVARREDKVVVCAELPGIKRADVQVEIRNDRLTIEGDRQQEPRAEQEYRRSERSYGHFYRCISLPEGIDPDGASASMHDGLLEITIPMRAGESGRRIDINPPQS